MAYDRVDLARRLLGVATQLFVDGKDPVSVRCLVSSAAEHASYLAKESGSGVFNDHILATFPEKTIKEIRKLRNRDWNVIKHSYENDGSPKDTPSELDGFGDETNDHALFLVWHDFSQSGQPLPVAAQVFQVWYLEMYPEKLDPTHEKSIGRTNLFGNLGGLPRAEAKQRLRQLISEASHDQNIIGHSKTDNRPLVLE